MGTWIQSEIGEVFLGHVRVQGLDIIHVYQNFVMMSKQHALSLLLYGAHLTDAIREPLRRRGESEHVVDLRVESEVEHTKTVPLSVHVYIQAGLASSA
jgi:hypothetical protein